MREMKLHVGDRQKEQDEKQEGPAGWVPEVGSHVMLKKFAPKSLQTHWEGPYTVLMVNEHATCLGGIQVATPVTVKTVKQLKPAN